jgi:hypothetical protein
MEVQIGPRAPTDSRSFIEYGYDALTFTQPNILNYPTDTPFDTIEKIDYTYFENVTKLILAYTAESADKEIDVQVRFVTPMEGCFYIFKYKILTLPQFNIFTSKLRGITYLFGPAIATINITTKDEIISVIYNYDGLTGRNYIKTEEPYDWEIQRPSWLNRGNNGKHRIGVHVHTSNGKTAYDEMEIYELWQFPIINLIKKIFNRIM